MHDPLDETLVRLVPDRLQRESAVAHGVVADRGQPALRDRELEADRPLQRDDLGGRLRLGDGGQALAGDDRGRPTRRTAERGEAESHEEDREEDDEKGDPARPARGARSLAFDPPPPVEA